MVEGCKRCMRAKGTRPRRPVPTPARVDALLFDPIGMLKSIRVIRRGPERGATIRGTKASECHGRLTSGRSFSPDRGRGLPRFPPSLQADYGLTLFLRIGVVLRL